MDEPEVIEEGSESDSRSGSAAGVALGITTEPDDVEEKPNVCDTDGLKCEVVDNNEESDTTGLFNSGYQPYSKFFTSPSSGNLRPAGKSFRKPKPFGDGSVPSGMISNESPTSDNLSNRQSKTFKCSECGAVIKNTGNLEVHMRRHLAYKPFHCTECGYAGYDETDIDRHLTRSHAGSQKAKGKFQPTTDLENLVNEMIQNCKALDSAGPSLEGWDDSAREKVSFSPYRSAFGDTATSNSFKDELIIDEDSGTEDLVVCGLCGDSFVQTSDAVIAHAKCHLDLDRHVCPFCSTANDSGEGSEQSNVSFDCVNELAEHMNEAHFTEDNFDRAESYVESSSQMLPTELMSLVENYFSLSGALGGMKGVPNLKCHCCALLIPWKHSKLLSHAKEHRGYYPYRCCTCDSPFSCTEDLVEHSHRDHPDVLVVVKCRFDVNEEKSVELDEMYRKCFPMLSLQYLESIKPDERGSDFKGQTAVIQPEAPDCDDVVNGEDLLGSEAGLDRFSVQCRLCQAKMSKNISCLIAHAKVHLAYKPLKCGHCNFRHFALSKIRRHNCRMHPNASMKVSYHPVAHIALQIKEMTTKCFGEVTDVSTTDFDRYIHEDEGAFLAAAGMTSSTPQKTSIGATHVGSALRHIVFGNAASRLTTVSPSKNLSNSYGLSSVSPSDSDQYGSDAMGFGKKICQMCNALIANNPSSFENHACKHLDYKPFHCQYCQYQSYIRGKVTRHIQQVHHGLPVKITHHPLPGIKDKIANIKMQCFPFLSGTSAPDMPMTVSRASAILQSAGVKVKNDPSNGEGKGDFSLLPESNDETEPKSSCQLCGTKVASEYQSLSDHLQSHIVSKFYHCPVCTYQTPYLIRAKQHVLSAHPECKNPSRIICCPPDGLKGLEILRVKCFGNSIGITGNDHSPSPSPSDDSYAQCGNGSIPVESVDDSVGDSDSLNGFESQEVTEGQDNDVSIEILDESIDDNVALSKLIHSKADTLTSADLIARQLNNNNNTNGKRGENEVKVFAAHKNLPLKLVYHPPNKLSSSCFPSLPSLQTSSSSTSLSGAHNLSIVKKLVCKLCNNSIADNPKSVGIHVKNHLNYKPFRCPFCKYMSCEQSKARRHVEHVHSVSGDSVLVATDENIKDKISEMKGRCFPNLGHMAVGDMYGVAGAAGDQNEKDDIYGTHKGGSKISQLDLDPDEDSILTSSGNSARCCLCNQTVPVDSINSHVRTHSVRVFNCSYCPEHFLNEAMVIAHIRASHAGSALRGIRKEMPLDKNLSETDEKFLAVKGRCFPQILAGEDDMDDEILDANSLDSTGENGDGRIIIRRSAEPGKIYCTLCDQTLSANNNSLDVHVKNHLNYKPHQCGYCDYRSCIVGKVKRHVDNVHRGSELKIISFNFNSNRMKEIFQELKVACFPQAMGFSGGIDGKLQKRSGLIALLDDLREKLSAEIQTLALTNGMTEGIDLSDTGMDDSFGGKTDDDDENDDNMEDDGGHDSLIIADSVAESSGVEPVSMLSMSRLKCQMCGTLIADNPSSIGLHVRNHLDYKPFCCNMCQYRSCIQAKVKRHLRNVHKCTTDEMMTYRPVADIRQQVNEMKLKCFPKGADQSEEIWRRSPATKLNGLATAATGRSSNLSGDDSFDEKPLAESLESISAYLDTVLGPIDGDSDVRKAEDLLQSQKRGKKRPLDADISAVCQACQEVVDNNEVAKSQHLVKHLGDHEFKCTYCTFMSLIQASVSRHVCLEHPSQTPRIARSPIKDRTAALERLMAEAFPRGTESESSLNGVMDGENSGDGMIVTCQLCNADVSVAQDEVGPHVEMHMKRPHFKCCHCFFIHSSNAVVKDHMRQEHNNRSAKIIYHPADPNGSEAVWKMKCFPEDDDLEMLEELGEELDDETGEESYVGGTTKIQSGDGPRYICQICQLPVSMYASSLYVHVKNHMNYKPYACDHCDYKSPVKSKVRRHIQNAHKGKPISISYSPTPGIDHEVMRWKRKCFPEVTSFATLTNEKIPCQKCQTDVADTPLSKTVHAKNHLDSKPYHCGYCSYKSCLRGETRRHVIRQHPGKALNISFHELEVVDKKSVDDMIIQCFHESPSNTGSKAQVESDLDLGMIDNLDISPSGVNLNAVMNLASEKKSSENSNSQPTAPNNNIARSLRSTSVKLGPAYREWYCCYCDFSSTSKYGVKQHSLSCHAGNPVDVSDVAFKLRSAEVAN